MSPACARPRGRTTVGQRFHTARAFMMLDVQANGLDRGGPSALNRGMRRSRPVAR